MDTIGAELEAVMFRLGEGAERAMYRAALLAKRRAVQAIGEVVPFQPVDTGEMRRSYTVDRVPGGAVLENTAPHAAIQEYGTRPFTPPMEPLVQWAIRKSRRAPQKKKKRGQRRARGKAAGQPKHEGAANSKRKANQLEAAKALARRAWVSIRARGVRPKGFHAAASKDFGKITHEALLHELRKVTQ
ncbi:MAG: hypothetical protein ABIL09_11080 [Gemmatimonadota bacterium]